ncbi:metalloprotease family M14A [Thraustotheca clavata]|uniref:tubulin-glutamate carboxypeptidase n=1 Tax=Thraustotheca clavata TaxID=74557 RepID=A0A1V9YYT6_9STRA|nr:metalloprotease family M14A [Thraustotheca clavata]
MSRVQSLLNRITEYAGDANTIKTCCGVLSILSRTEDKKTEIATSGLLLILQSMHTHMGNEELLEAACDLLWTLAFNNRTVKASISAHGGIHTLLRCIDAHKTNAELIRSVLGTLSNLSELTENQHHIGIGLPIILSALQLHHKNLDLLAFSFDTLASIIVGDKKNCYTLQQSNAIPFILDTIQKHPNRLDLIKSGCHTLAIMCDLAGVGTAIAEAKGLKILLQLLALVSLPADIERILTVLIFRISKEPVVLVQLINDGILVLLFKSLAHRSAPQAAETLLATSHILCQIARYANENRIDLSPYLPSPICSGETLVRLASHQSTTPSLVLSLFRILAYLTKNPKELPGLVNMASVEQMLALCNAHGNPPEMLHLTIEVFCQLRRSTIQNYALKTPEKSLTALLVCIRNFPDDIALLDLAFGVVMAFVTSERATNPRTVYGFIGAAMRFLNRFSSSDWSPHLMIEACRFLLHTMGTKDGQESIISCGGLSILRKFQEDVSKNTIPPELAKLLNTMCRKLDPTKMLFNNNILPEPEPQTSSIETNHPHPQDILASHRTPTNTTDDRYFYYRKSLPKHPLKPLGGNKTSSNVLTTTCPWTLEPVSCSFADDVEMQLYIEERRQERVNFIDSLQHEPFRAQLVYQSCDQPNDPGRVTSEWSPYEYQVPLTSTPMYTASLTFDSEFESGNLLRAIQIGDYEYDLVLRADINTTGFMQWFYFAVSNVQVTPVSYRFNIINLYKPDSLFNAGLQPVVYSVRDAEIQAMGWKRSGNHVCYYSNPWPQCSRSNTESVYYYHTLTFSLEFPHTKDTYLIAHSYPYTLGDHAWHLRQPQFQSQKIVQRTVLCKTQGDLDCDLLKITDFEYTANSSERLDIVLTARVHPGEPQASWVMRGVLDFLVSDLIEAKLLRRLFVVPMLNPDGVFHGNNRCGLSACDLNRQWKTPCRIQHPTIHYAKRLIESLNVVFYCDIHGHSRKMNVFMYGCDSKKHPNPIARYFPRLLSQHHNGQRYVLYESCNFQVNRGREATARVVVGRDMGIANSFTLEASFCGADYGVLAQMHFNLRHFIDIGQSLIDFAIPTPIDRQPLHEWIQQSEVHPSLYTYISSQYNQKDALWNVMPLHLTKASACTSEVKKKPKKNKLKIKKKVKPKTLIVPPLLSTPSTKGTKMHIVPKSAKKSKSAPLPIPKPPKAIEKTKKDIKTSIIKSSAATPPPIALKRHTEKCPTRFRRSDTPIPDDNNHIVGESRLARVREPQLLQQRSATMGPSGFRRLALTTAMSNKEEEIKRHRRISFPNVTK